MNELSSFRKDGIYHRRWQWWFPWGTTRWWEPRFFKGADEWCNESICLVLPPLGTIVVFWWPGKMRVVPCSDDWGHMSDVERADYAPCGWLYAGMTHENDHHHDAIGHPDWPCEEAERWLAMRTGASGSAPA